MMPSPLASTCPMLFDLFKKYKKQIITPFF